MSPLCQASTLQPLFFPVDAPPLYTPTFIPFHERVFSSYSRYDCLGAASFFPLSLARGVPHPIMCCFLPCDAVLPVPNGNPFPFSFQFISFTPYLRESQPPTPRKMILSWNRDFFNDTQSLSDPFFTRPPRRRPAVFPSLAPRFTSQKFFRWSEAVSPLCCKQMRPPLRISL